MVTLNSIDEGDSVSLLSRGISGGSVQKPLGLFNFKPRGLFPKVLGSAASRSKQVPRGLRREIWALGGLDCKGRRLGGRRERERGSRWIDVREKSCIA